MKLNLAPYRVARFRHRGPSASQQQLINIVQQRAARSRSLGGWKVAFKVPVWFLGSRGPFVLHVLPHFLSEL